nr:helix-turn-helix transcriptional regulator [Mogibacterium diversum]
MRILELGKKIKYYRNEKAVTQDELAERVFVSRQTISNWENDKSYPDINSILLLSEVLDVPIDNLIKGDVEQMKDEINTEEVRGIKVYSTMMQVFLLVAVVLLIPLIKFIGLYALIPCFGLWGCGMASAIKVEKIKKNNDVQTFKEIVAFTEGKRLDELKKLEERAKRPYQKILSVIATILITALICGVSYLIFR